MTLYLSVSCISAASLALEFLLLRIFSVIEDHTATYMVISLALAGMGAGGALAARRIQQRNNVSLDVSLSWLAVLFSISIPGIFFTLQLIPDALFKYYKYIIVLPFIISGYYLSTAFSFPFININRLYLFDLVGASIGSILTIVALSYWDPMFIIGFLCVVVALLALVTLPSLKLRKRIPVYLSIVVVTLISIFWEPDIIVLGMKSNERPLFQSLSSHAESAAIVHTEHNLLGRLDLAELSGSPVAFAYIDGAVPSWVYAAAGNPDAQAAMQRILPNFSFLWGDRDSILIIGSGGGLDVHLALKGGAMSVAAVDINPAFDEILRMYAHENDSIHDSPQVSWIYKEGRRYVKDTTRRFDMVFLSLVQLSSKRSYQEGHLGNYLYTVDAFEDYWRVLRSNGRLVIITHNDVFQDKLLLTALSFLRNQGFADDEIRDMIIALKVNEKETFYSLYSHLVMIKKSQFTVQELKEASRVATQFGHVIYQFPHGPTSDVLDIAIERGLPSAIDASRPWDVRPTGDATPRFFNIELRSPVYLVNGFVVFSLLVSASALFMFFRFQRYKANIRELKIMTLFFIFIGIGFIGIEITWINRLVVFIGHPTVNSFFVIIVVLLSAGVGSILSWLIGPRNQMHTARTSLLIILGLLVIFGLSLDRILQTLDSASFTIRILASGIFVVPFGLCLGVLFPAGLSLIKQSSPKDIPLFWGINALSMVLGSCLILLIHFYFGLTHSFLVLAVLYVYIYILTIMISRQVSPG